MRSISILTPALRNIRRDARGATVVEFAIIAPVMLLLLLGTLDIAHTLYTRAVLQGVVQKVGRDSSLESGAATARQDVLDARVKAQVTALASDANVTITRRYYRSLTEASKAQPEDFTDTNSNGKCDAGEPYQDQNNNNVWDRDGGNGGQGGARDATIYTVKMTYPRLIPVFGFYDASPDVTLSATTLLRNQPYDNQQSYDAPAVRNCP